MSKMSSEEEEAVQAELETLQREAVVGLSTASSTMGYTHDHYSPLYHLYLPNNLFICRMCR